MVFVLLWPMGRIAAGAARTAVASLGARQALTMRSMAQIVGAKWRIVG